MPENFLGMQDPAINKPDVGEAALDVVESGSLPVDRDGSGNNGDDRGISGRSGVCGDKLRRLWVASQSVHVSTFLTYWHVTRLPEAPEQQQVVPAILPAKDGAGGAGVIVNVEGRHGVARVISLRLARRVRP
jgi:hypothetical protein